MEAVLRLSPCKTWKPGWNCAGPTGRLRRLKWENASGTGDTVDFIHSTRVFAALPQLSNFGLPMYRCETEPGANSSSSPTLSFSVRGNLFFQVCGKTVSAKIVALAENLPNAHPTEPRALSRPLGRTGSAAWERKASPPQHLAQMVGPRFPQAAEQGAQGLIYADNQHRTSTFPSLRMPPRIVFSLGCLHRRPPRQPRGSG